MLSLSSLMKAILGNPFHPVGFNRITKSGGHVYLCVFKRYIKCGSRWAEIEHGHAFVRIGCDLSLPVGIS